MSAACITSVITHKYYDEQVAEQNGNKHGNYNYLNEVCVNE